MLERLQKILSAQGIASRRKAEEYIEAGLVKVNGVVAKLGDKADPEKDKVEVDGKVLQERAEMLYYLINKPVGVVTSNIERWSAATKALAATDESIVLSEGRKRSMKRNEGRTSVPQSLQDTTVRDLIPQELRGKIYPVGRLDKESGGLLLLTNDGPLAFRLTHPKFDHDKEYEVLVNAPIPDEALNKMERGGMIIDGAAIKPTRIRRLDNDRFSIVLTEGKNRQIRRMCEKVGFPVQVLTRVRIMTISDPLLKPGRIRVLSKEEKSTLLASVGL